MAELNKSWARCLGVSEPLARLHAQVLPNSYPSNLAQDILHQIWTSLGQDALVYLEPGQGYLPNSSPSLAQVLPNWSWARYLTQDLLNTCPAYRSKSGASLLDKIVLPGQHSHETNQRGNPEKDCRHVLESNMAKVYDFWHNKCWDNNHSYDYSNVKRTFGDHFKWSSIAQGVWIFTSPAWRNLELLGTPSYFFRNTDARKTTKQEWAKRSRSKRTHAYYGRSKTSCFCTNPIFCFYKRSSRSLATRATRSS